MKKIKVMTFNMKNDSFFTNKIRNFQYRKDAIISIIKNTNPDVVGVQELTLPMKYELKKHLNGYDFYGNPRTHKKNLFNEHTDILILREKFIATECETFWLSDNPHISGSKHLLSLFPRICTCITMQNRYTSERFRIFNSHLDPLLQKSRLKQLSRLLIELNKKNQQSPLPTILMGDFNAHKTSEVIRLIDNHPLGFRSIYQSKPHFNTFHFSLGKIFTQKSPIDYIYASNQLELNYFKIITDKYNGIYPSDHFPVLAEFTLNQQK